jgi:hypothetical protein
MLSNSKAFLNTVIIGNENITILKYCHGKEHTGLKIFIYKAPHGIDIYSGVNYRVYWRIEDMLLEKVKEMGGKSGCITEDPEEANIFWLHHRIISNVGYGHKHTAHSDFNRYWDKTLQPFLKYIVNELPYFNRSNGANHLLVWALDSGPFCDFNDPTGTKIPFDPFFKSVIGRMMIVGYHGRLLDSPDNAIQVEEAKSEYRSHCFSPEFDITLPQFHEFEHSKHVSFAARQCAQDDVCAAWSDFIFEKTKTSAFFFRGSVPAGIMAARTNIQTYCTSLQSKDYCMFQQHQNMKSNVAVYAFCPRGHAPWSSRYYDAIFSNTIPVRIANSIYEPFAKVINYSLFSESVIIADENNYTSMALEFDKLHDKYVSFQQTCGTVPNVINHTGCFDHIISSQLMHGVAVQQWFGWDVSNDKNAVLLFIRELYHRVTYPDQHPRIP